MPFMISVFIIEGNVPRTIPTIGEAFQSWIQVSLVTVQKGVNRREPSFLVSLLEDRAKTG